MHDLERGRLTGVAQIDEGLEQQPPGARISGERRRIACDGLGRELARVAVDRQLLGDRDPEQPDHLARPLDEQPRITDRELAVERDERGVDLGDPRPPARRDARRLEQAIGDLDHTACVEVVVLHQRLDRRGDGRTNVAVVRLRVRIQRRRDRLLDLERQLIEAAPRRQLDERADPELKSRALPAPGPGARSGAHRDEIWRSARERRAAAVRAAADASARRRTTARSRDRATRRSPA